MLCLKWELLFVVGLICLISNINAANHNFSDFPDGIMARIADWTNKESYFALKNTNRRNFHSMTIPREMIVESLNDLFTTDLLTNWRQEFASLERKLNLDLTISLETIADRIMNNYVCNEFWYLIVFSEKYYNKQDFFRRWPYGSTLMKLVERMRRSSSSTLGTLQDTIRNPELNPKDKIYAYKQYLEQLCFKEIELTVGVLPIVRFNGTRLVNAIFFINDLITFLETGRVYLHEMKFTEKLYLPEIKEISECINQLLKPKGDNVTIDTDAAIFLTRFQSIQGEIKIPFMFLSLLLFLIIAANIVRLMLGLNI